MNIKLYSPLFIKSDSDTILPAGESAGAQSLFLVCDDDIVAHALYDYIISHFDLNKEFSHEQFNEALEESLNSPEHRVKTCNLALVAYSSAGCFVAQMGKSRVLQVCPETGDIEYDSRAQVLDIYSSKARVELIKEVRQGDYIMLCSAEDIDAKAMRKVLCNEVKDDNAKMSNIAQAIKRVKTSSGDSPAVVLNRVEQVNGGAVSLAFMKKMKIKYFVNALIACVVVAVGMWLLTNPFASNDAQVDTTVPADSLVTTKAPNRADTTYVKPPIDSLAVAAQLDSLKRVQFQKDSARLVAKKKADALKKAQQQAAVVRDEDIKVVHSSPSQPVAPEPAKEPAEAPQQGE